MNITPIIINILLFSGVVLGLTAFYGNIQTAYNPANSTSIEDFQKFNNSFTSINVQMSNIENHTVGFTTKGITSLSAWNDALMAFIDVGGVILQMPKILTIFVFQGLGFLPYIPNWFILMVQTIIIVVFVMAVAAIFLKRDEV